MREMLIQHVLTGEVFAAVFPGTTYHEDNTYRFADYKDKVIDLLARVTAVSVETTKIVASMRQAPRS